MTDTPAMPGRRPGIGPVATIAAGAAGLLAFGAADLAAGFALPGPKLASAAEVGMLAASILGSAALFGLALGAAAVALRAVGAVVRAAARGRLDGTLWLAWILLSAGFVFANLETFEGPKARAHRFHDAIVWGHRIVGPVVILAALRILRRLLAGRSTLWTTLLAGAALLTAAAAQGANAIVLVGKYERLHDQLVAVSVLGWSLAALILLRGRPRASLAAIAIGVVLVLAGVLARRHEDYRAVAGAVIKRGPGVVRLESVTDPVFHRLAPPREIDFADVAVDLGSLHDEEARRRAQDWLDARLPGRRELNVLLVALDTVRADHVGFNGYARNTTPRLDRLAKDGWVFKNAYSTYPTSNYSYSSLFHGLYAGASPVYGEIFDKGWTFPETSAFPALFARSGWTSIGVTAFNRRDLADRATFGALKDGFNVFNPDQIEGEMDGPAVTRSMVEAITAQGARRFFAWAHYLEPHAAYLRWPDFDFGPNVLDCYDSEIAYTDHQVGLLLDALEERRLLDRTVVVAFSDHGEEFGERGATRTHNSNVYRLQTHVPLLVWVPGLKGRVVEEAVSLADILPTIAALVGVDDPHRRHGRDLLPLMLDPAREGPGLAYSEFFRMEGGSIMEEQHGVVRGKDKLVRMKLKRVYELYDLEKDPLELENMVGRADETERSMRALLASLEATVEGHHAAGGDTGDDPSEVYRRRLWEKAEDACSKDGKRANEGRRDLVNMIFNWLREPDPQAVYHLPEGEVERVALWLVAQWEQRNDRMVRQRITDLLCELQHPATRDFLLARLPEEAHVRVRVACALARMGEDLPEIRSLLRSCVAFPSWGPPDLREIAIALASLGDLEAARELIIPTITTPRWLFVGQMIATFPKMRPPAVGWVLRDLITERLLKPVPLQRLIARNLGAMPQDEETRRLLLRFALDPDPATREAAAGSLAAAGISEEELERYRETVPLELDGDLCVQNRAFETAFERYEAVLAGDPDFNPGLRLRYARYLQLAERRDRARALLESVRDRAESPIDKALAERRLAMLDAPARFTDPADVKLAISELEIPEHCVPNHAFRVRFRLRNEGKVPIQGGAWLHAAWIGVAWHDLAGNPVPVREDCAWLFVPGGLLPGEEIPVAMLAFPPPGTDLELVPTFGFRQEWLLPDREMVPILKAPKPVLFSYRPRPR